MIMVGAGNNGGDALFAGVRLARRGARVTAIRCLGDPHPAGLAALADAQVAELIDLDDHHVTDPMAYDLVIDGILGIGGRPGLPDPVARLVQSVEVQGIPTIAVDLPSGVAADTGAVPGAAVRATRTVTFGERKPCHLLQPALSRCGAISVVDIGLGTDHDETADLVGLDEDDLARAWPYPTERSDKYARGVVGVDTGSDQYPGAAVMSVYGAVYGGAGYVRFLGAERPGRDHLGPVAERRVLARAGPGASLRLWLGRTCRRRQGAGRGWPSRDCQQSWMPTGSAICRNLLLPAGC